MSKWNDFKWWLSDLFEKVMEVVRMVVTFVLGTLLVGLLGVVAFFLHEGGVLWHVLGGLGLTGLIASPFVVYVRMKGKLQMQKKRTKEQEDLVEIERTGRADDKKHSQSEKSQALASLRRDLENEKARTRRASDDASQHEKVAEKRSVEIELLRTLGGFQNISLIPLLALSSEKREPKGVALLWRKIVLEHRECSIPNVLLAEDLFNAVISRLACLGIPIRARNLSCNVDGKKDPDTVAGFYDKGDERYYFLSPGESSRTRPGRAFSVAFRIHKGDKVQVTIFPVSWEKRESREEQLVA